MSRLGSTFSKQHRKDNYSLDIKNIYKTGIINTPFSKKLPHHQPQQKYFTRLRTQVIHHTSSHHHESDFQSNEVSRKQSRRLSLNKTFKANNSIGIDQHLIQEKLKKIKQYIAEQRYQQCIQLIRQVLLKQQNQFMKNKLYWLNAKCYQKLGKIKQAQNNLTRLLNQQPDKYQALVQRAKVRYFLGAKQLSIRDLKHAIYLQPAKQDAYSQLCKIYIQIGEYKQGYQVAQIALEKSVESIELLIIAVELLLTNPIISLSSQEKAANLINKLQKNLCKNSNNDSSQQKNSADQLYLQGLLLQTKYKVQQSCIYYQQCLKFNNSKFSVTKSLQHLLLIKIQQRDYYSAYHTVNRYKILNIQIKYIYPYVMFLEGVILIMKKKYVDGIKLFDMLIQILESNQISNKLQVWINNQIRQSSQNKLNINKNKQNNQYQITNFHHSYKKIISPLLYKFNAYASFKLGKHERSIVYYEKLASWGLDQCSSYNLLLAEGIVAVEKKKNFQLGMEKFQQARYVYPCKVEPSIYIAMTVIYRDLCLSGILSNQQNQSDTLTSAVIHAMQQLNQAHQTVNDSSSNLLYHRCILNLYMQQWQSAQADINLCIQKAQQNQPKYFYLRGLSYAVVKDLKRAINQYSISLSLDADYQLSLLQRSKCYFLLGETEIGFSDLKQYMYKNPNNYQVHKWIGDLLYQGRSYSDAYKAYQQVQQCILFQNQIMKCKCLLRISDLNKISDTLTKLTKLQQCNQTKIQVDILAISILKQLSHLSKNSSTNNIQNNKQLSTKLKKLNTLLQENNVGYIFNLIDCMNLLGICTFEIGRYEEAYQSFLLSLQLFVTLYSKNKTDIKADCSQQGLSLTIQDIYINIVNCLIAMKDYENAVKLLKQQLIFNTKNQVNLRKLTKIIQKYESDDKNFELFHIESDTKKNQKIRFKSIQLRMKNIKIKCQPIFALFHKSAQDLYSKSIAQKLVHDLKPSYIDNMPQGPWIKRNQHGVIFTDNVIEDQGNSDFLSSMRQKQSEQDDEASNQRSGKRVNSNQVLDSIGRRQEFKRKMLLDKQLEKKLNSIIQKSQRSNQQ